MELKKKGLRVAVSTLALLVFCLYLIPVHSIAVDNGNASGNRFNVVTVLDASGSMKSTDPSDLRFEAVNLFVHLLAEKGNVLGGVAFSNDVNGVQPPQPVDNLDSKKAVVDSLRGVKPAGYTNIGKALDEAVSMLKSKGNPDLPSVILFLSDGNTEMPSDDQLKDSLQKKSDAIQNARDEGIRVFSICLNVNGDADSSEMKQISDATNGVFQEVKSAEDLQNVFNSFYSLIYGTSTVELVDSVFPANGEIDAEFTLPGMGVEEVNIIIYGKINNMRLTQPDGNEVVPELIQSNSFTMTKITEPIPGLWKLKAFGESGGQIKINMVYNSDMEVTVRSEPSELELNPNDVVKITAQLLGKESKEATAEQCREYSAELKVMDPLDQEIDSVVMEQDGNRYVTEYQFAEGTYKYYVKVTGNNLEKNSDVIGPVVVDATHNNTPPEPKKNPVKDRVFFWPFTDGATYTLDLNTLAADKQDSKLAYQIISTSFIEGKDYTIQNDVITMENFSIPKGAFTIRAVDSGGLTCDVEVIVQSYNIGILALIGLLAAGLLGLILMGVLLWIATTRAFNGSISAFSYVDFHEKGRKMENPGRGRRRLSSFDVDNTGFNMTKSYFQATGKGYVFFITDVPMVTANGMSVKKLKLDSGIPQTVKVSKEDVRELRIRYDSRSKKRGKSYAPRGYGGPPGGGSGSAPGRGVPGGSRSFGPGSAPQKKSKKIFGNKH